jgi:hypothetical protein
MNQFLWGALTMACWTAGLFFLRFWQLSKDRLFLFFWLAFWVLAVHWLSLAVINPPQETRHYAYLVRFLAFALIALGIIDKNRATKKGH